MTPVSYKDPFWSNLAQRAEQEVGLPANLLQNILLKGERSNADQVSSAGARTPFQVIPETRQALLRKYNVDAYAGPEQAAKAAALLLKESLERNKGDITQAVGEYIGGTNRKNWGPVTNAYIQRVTTEGKPMVTAQQFEKIYSAYQSGQMSPQEVQEFEADMNAGVFGNMAQNRAQSKPNYGMRADNTPKGSGFMGEIATPDGKVMTENSIGIDFGMGEMEIPTIVPTLTPQEVQYLAQGGEPTEAIVDKAVAHAKQRIQQGQSPFASSPSAQSRQQPMQLPAGVVKAYRDGRMTPQERAELEADIQAGLVAMPSQQPMDVPTPANLAATSSPVAPQEETGFLDTLAGAGETALALGTGATTGMLGMLGGAAIGAGQMLADGTFGTQEGVKTIQKAALGGMQGGTYQPRTQAGLEMVQATGEVLSEALPPVLPILGAPGAVAQNIAPALRQAAPAVNQVAQRIQNIPSQVRSAVQPNGVARQSAGAAATPAVQQRIATAENLPVPMQLTKGAATRDPAQLAFEKEQMKNPSLGQPLRNRIEENNLQALQNFDAAFDAVGAETITPSATGNKVVDALTAGYKEAKARTRAAYNRANNSAEAQAKVDFSVPVQLTRGEEVINTDLFTYLNETPSGLPSNKVADAAKTYAVRLGIAKQDENGNLIPNSPTIKQLEQLRREVQSSVGNEPNDRRLAAEIKNLIDAHTEPVAGPLYKAARAERTKQARKFENRAIVARLISNRRGMDDPQVAVDKVFDNTILKGSPEEITFLKRVLTTSNKDGQQAWKELQGATLNYLREKSTSNNQFDSQGRPIVSSAALNKAVKDLDQNGRLDLVVGKQNAQVMRDLNEVLQYVTTVPPGTLINNSGTAATLLAAITEAGATGVVTGLPVPALTILKQLKSSIDNKRLKVKITNALNAKSQEQ